VLIRGRSLLIAEQLSCQLGLNPVATSLVCYHCRSDFDDSMSGTTAITVLIRGRSLLVANVGDSRAVLAEKRQGEPGYIARDLSIDQTPYRYAMSL
jgi:serine/threonine protein phosphatase PrpC